MNAATLAGMSHGTGWHQLGFFPSPKGHSRRISSLNLLTVGSAVSSGMLTVSPFAASSMSACSTSSALHPIRSASKTGGLLSIQLPENQV